MSHKILTRFFFHVFFSSRKATQVLDQTRERKLLDYVSSRNESVFCTRKKQECFEKIMKPGLSSPVSSWNFRMRSCFFLSPASRKARDWKRRLGIIMQQSTVQAHLAYFHPMFSLLFFHGSVKVTEHLLISVEWTNTILK